MEFTADIKEGRTDTSTEASVFSSYEPAQWKVGTSDNLAFPVLRIREEGGNRIIPRERPFRDGEKLDDSGSKAKRWTMTAVFENSIIGTGDVKGLGEPDIRRINGDKSLYPDVLQEMLDSFDIHETGDLVVPTRGSVRARAETYSRNESFDQRDCAVVDFVFVEDNEDDVIAKSFTTATASANARVLAEATTFDAQSAGSWDDAMESFVELMADMQNIATMPEEYQRDVDMQTSAVIGAANTTTKIFSQSHKTGRDIFSDAESSRTRRKLEEGKEVAADAAFNLRKRDPLISVVFNRRRSLVQIAGELQQDFETLLSVNKHIANPLYIEPGTIVRVLSNAPSTG